MRGKHDGTWRRRDQIMALALTLYEDGLCAGCGLHRSQTHGDHNVGRWETKETICHGCSPFEAERDRENRDKYPGQKLTLQEVEGF